MLRQGIDGGKASRSASDRASFSAMSSRVVARLVTVAIATVAVAACQSGENAPPAPRPSAAPPSAPEPAPSPPAPSAAPSAAPTKPAVPSANAEPPIVPVPVPNGPPIPGATPYARDVARICRVEELVALDPSTAGSSPTLMTAQYLAANLETQQARDLMVKITGSPYEERAGLLDAAAAEVGLTTGCPTARRWDEARQP
jgi:hypothetical protein